MLEEVGRGGGVKVRDISPANDLPKIMVEGAPGRMVGGGGRCLGDVFCTLGPPGGSGVITRLQLPPLLQAHSV